MLRAATDEDRELVRVWRNHPDVRAVSLTRDVISPEDHAKYWESLRDNETRKVFMYERGGVPAGVVTFFDIEYDAQAFDAPLPRIRVIPIEEFDPTQFLR